VLKPPPALPRASECNDSGRSAEAPTRAAASECNDSGRSAKAPTRAAARPAPAWDGRGGGFALRMRSIRPNKLIVWPLLCNGCTSLDSCALMLN